MRRTRIGVQLGLLSALALGFALAPGPSRVSAGGDIDCPQEGECTFQKPALLFALDYSTALNQVHAQTQQTRWELLTEVLAEVVQPGSYLSQTTRIALLRYGHDPDPASSGTTIPGDISGLVDGVALDLAWDDPAAPHDWVDCAGQQVVDILAATPAPMLGAPSGIGSWTRGGLARAAAEIAQTRVDHPEDAGERQYAIVVLTDGVWTGPDGVTAPAGEDPVPLSATLDDEQDVRTFVVAVPPDASAEAAAHALANAGGTNLAMVGGDADELFMVLANLVQSLIDSIIGPNCTGVHPRVMVLLDASSTMLNTGDGLGPAAMGESAWDQARRLIYWDSEPGLFDVDVGLGTLENLVFLGLAVYGGDLPAPGEQRILTQYRRCGVDPVRWALDPVNSCVAPGCTDPWAGAPIDWTVQDGSQTGPCYWEPISTHMPLCKGQGPCAGSGSFVHLGLERIASNRASYHAEHTQNGDPIQTNAGTPYFNLLITDGSYTGYSTDAQVQAALAGMLAEGVITYVIGVGPDAAGPDADPTVLTQLDQMAAWGSGGAYLHFDGSDPGPLRQVLAARIEALEFDPCCAFVDCSGTDLEPPNPNCSGTGDGDGDPGDGDGDPGDGDGDPGDGDGDPGDGDGEPGDGDGESGGSSGEDTDTDTAEDGETETSAPSPMLVEDGGCSCRSDPASRGAGPVFAWLGLVGLHLHRRRSRRLRWS